MGRAVEDAVRRANKGFRRDQTPIRRKAVLYRLQEASNGVVWRIQVDARSDRGLMKAGYAGPD